MTWNIEVGRSSSSIMKAEEMIAKLSQKETVDELVGATRRRTPLLNTRVVLAAMLGLSATGVACGYSVYRISQSEADFNSLQRAHVTSTATQTLNAIQRQLETSVSSTKALSALIHVDEGQRLMEPLCSEINELQVRSQDVAALADAPEAVRQSALQAKKAVQDKIVMNASTFRFNTVAESLIRSYKGISNLQLAPAGIVSVIHPIQGNEGAIGHDLFFDPSRQAGAKQAIAQGGVIFVGPVKLIQSGKIAIIARNPTFITRPGFVGHVPEYPSWWGFTTMLCTLDDLFATTPLASATTFQMSYVMYALDSSGKKFLHASPDVVGAENTDIQASLESATKQAPMTVQFSVTELNVHWVMLVWPKDGWKAHSDTFVLQVSLCTFFTVCSTIGTYSVMVRVSVIQQVEGILGPTPSSVQLPPAAGTQTASWAHKRPPSSSEPPPMPDQFSVVPL